MFSIIFLDRKQLRKYYAIINTKYILTYAFHLSPTFYFDFETPILYLNPYVREVSYMYFLLHDLILELHTWIYI